MNLKQIEAYLLKSCTNGPASGCAAGTGLTAIHKAIFVHKTNPPKDKMAKDLAEFYAKKENIEAIWNELNECERDFVTYIVQYDGTEYRPTTIEYAKKHNFTLETENMWGGKERVYDSNWRYAHYLFLHMLKNAFPKTKATMLFPSGKDTPPFVKDVLESIVPPFRFEYEEISPAKDNYVICREHRLGDFAAVVRFVSGEKLKAKKDTYDITKAKLAKLAETAGFDEVCDKEGKFCTPKEAKRNNDFKVATPLFVLAANSGLVDVALSGDVSPGRRSPQLLALSNHELAKKLFADYMRKNKIYELHYITYVTAYDGNFNIEWDECRKPIIKLLKNCPVEKFIRFEDFDKYARIFCGNFFRRLVRCAIMLKGYDFGYNYWGSYEPDWDECESQIIRLILSFLCAIGMVDIAYSENVVRIKEGDDFCVGISAFRITKLGAWIFGLSGIYEASEEISRPDSLEGGLVVLPDYSVVISGLKCRIEHETYLSKFLTKVTNDEHAAVYKIDFQSAIRAFDLGITPQKVLSYLKSASDKPIPDNVIRSFNDWQAKTGRVKIKTITMLQTDDPLLLEEIRHIKGMDTIIVHELKNAVSIIGGTENKAKTLIEKNGWLVN